MSTYKNCYRLVRDVRQGINEFDDALASGEDAVGAYTNEFIVERINESIARIYALILKRRPNEFIQEASIAGVNSIFALPANFGKLVLFRDQYLRKVYPMAQVERRLVDQTGSERLYYQRGGNLYLDASGISATYSLIYKPKPRDIHMGRAAAAGTAAITLQANQRKSLVDYYNGMIIENETAGWVHEITDYTALGVASTATNFNAAQGDLYGLVPELPEWAWPLIAPAAVIACKLNPISKEQPSQKEIDAYVELQRAVLAEYAADDDDQDVVEMFTNFPPNVAGETMF
jgi:hypothetical protein